MTTDTQSVNREVHELYISKINNLIAEGRESLIASLVADFDQISRDGSRAVDQAA
jgi:hypothetical protein